MSKIKELVDTLNEDLGREFKHFLFYMQAATVVRGLHREELSEFFLEEADGEKKHIEEFKRMIIGVSTRRKLNVEPTVTGNLDAMAQTAFAVGSPTALLEFALTMEDEVVKNYTERIQQACELQETGDPEDAIDGKYIELFLEEQILDSRADADNIREMVRNLS